MRLKLHDCCSKNKILWLCYSKFKLIIYRIIWSRINCYNKLQPYESSSANEIMHNAFFEYFLSIFFINKSQKALYSLKISSISAKKNKNKKYEKLKSSSSKWMREGEKKKKTWKTLQTAWQQRLKRVNKNRYT